MLKYLELNYFYYAFNFLSIEVDETVGICIDLLKNFFLWNCSFG